MCFSWVVPAPGQKRVMLLPFRRTKIRVWFVRNFLSFGRSVDQEVMELMDFVLS